MAWNFLRSGAAAIAAVLLLAAAASATPTRISFGTQHETQGQWRPGSEEIAFLQSGGGQLEVGTVQSNGTGEGFITTAFSVATNANALSWVGGSDDILIADIAGHHENWSHDSSSGSSTALMTHTGGQRHGGAVDVSRDGQWVLWRDAFNTGSTANIHVAPYQDLVDNATQNAASAGPLVLSGPRGIGVRGISFLPDGSKFVVSIPDLTGDYDLWLVDAQENPGGGFDAAFQITATAGSFDAQNPDVSPDGTQVLFNLGIEGTPGSYDVYSINLDGSGLSPIVATPGVDEGGPSWASDGERFVFHRFDTDLPSEPDNWNLYVTSIPEPSTALLLTLGLAALCRRRA